jgi:quercetin dioxygenase-like cupin family protein
MQVQKLSSMIKGWFVGNFEPSVYKTNDCEVAIKEYTAGDYEEAHYHKIAKEITVILNGEVEMNRIKYVSGDIIILEPGEPSDFLALTEVTSVVVKIPGANNDKYKVED